jgi:DNA polymerase (family X)
VRYGEVKQVLRKGLPAPRGARLRPAVRPARGAAKESFGAALHYFTGSKAHNIAVSKLGIARGLKINEYGVWKGKRRIAGETEESVYAAVGLPYIEPELREDSGELEAARRGELPRSSSSPT